MEFWRFSDVRQKSGIMKLIRDVRTNQKNVGESGMAYIVPDGRDVKSEEIEIIETGNQTKSFIRPPCTFIA